MTPPHLPTINKQDTSLYWNSSENPKTMNLSKIINNNLCIRNELHMKGYCFCGCLFPREQASLCRSEDAKGFLDRDSQLPRQLPLDRQVKGTNGEPSATYNRNWKTASVARIVFPWLNEWLHVPHQFTFYIPISI